MLMHSDKKLREKVNAAIKSSGKKFIWLSAELGFKSPGGLRKALARGTMNPVLEQRMWKLLGVDPERDEESSPHFVEENTVSAENMASYQTKLYKLANSVNHNLPVENPGIISLPFYDINLPNLPMLSELIKTQPDDLIRMPGHEGGDFTFRFFADNMIGRYHPGDYLTAQILTDTSEFIPGACYLIIRKQSREVAYLQEGSTPDFYRVISENTSLHASGLPRHPDYEVRKDSVIDLAFIIGSGTINRSRT
jgi:hypothetical protein